MEKESKFAIIKYEEIDFDLISKLCSYIDSKAQKVIDFFDSKFELPKIKINIISTKEKYDKIIGNQMFDGHTPDWVVGNYDRKNNEINYVSYHDYQNTSHKKDDFESYLQTLMHEYIHYLTAMYSNSIDSNYPIKYISEGLAYYLSGQGKRVKYQKEIDYNSMIYGTSNYSMWYLFVKYIIEQKGKEYFFKLYSNNTLAEDAVTALLDEVNEYYRLEKFNSIKTPEELLAHMDNIKYGFIGKNGKMYLDMHSEEWKDWYYEYHIQKGEEVLKSNIGTCWDKVELERLWFEKHNYTFKTIFAMIQVDRENDYQTHTFLIYNKDNKWCWFEHSFPGLKGIHEFNTEKELINCFKKIYIKNIKYECEDFLDSDIDKFAYYEYNKPNKNMSVQEFFDFILI